MKGFLSLEKASLQLAISVHELAREIEEGRVVAILRDGNPWLSEGEVNRLETTLRQRQAANASSKTAEAAESVEAQASIPPLGPKNLSSPSEEAKAPQAPSDSQASEWETKFSRLQKGLQETEASLRRSKNARANLENDVIRLTEQLKKAQSKAEALERDVQRMSEKMEQTEEQHSSEVRRLRSRDRSSDSRDGGGASEEESHRLRQLMAEKDRIIAQEYDERALLRTQLDDVRQKYFELKARYDKEKSEWSEILAREIQTQSQLKAELEELRPRNKQGWNPFRREK